MEKCNITKSILSITSPGTHLSLNDHSNARRITRQCNEFAADIKRNHPEKFGFWASLPLPDVDGSLEELAYALDVLNADGITVLTNSHGIYLGDPKFEVLMEEFNRRKVKVFVHPTTPCSCDGQEMRAATPLGQYPNPIFEFFFDSARAVTNLFLSRTVNRFPDITYILTHAGGVLPPLIERIVLAAFLIDPPIKLYVNDIKEAFNRQFYFDLAGAAFPTQIQSLRNYAEPQRMLYGTDFPFSPGPAVVALWEKMNLELPKEFEKQSDCQDILIRNAERLLG